MFAHFLPSSVAEIQDAGAIALLQTIQHRTVEVPFQQGLTAFSTAYVHFAPQLSSCFLDTPPILLLHGFDSSLLEFRRLLPFLSGGSDVWAIDLFGSGFTEHPAAISVNPESIRQHLLSIVETWIGEPIVLAGASLGGAVAIDFALHHPNWVRSLALIDSVGSSGSFPIGQFLPQGLIDLGANWLYFRKRAALAAASVLPMVNPTLIDALRCSLLHQEMPGWKEAIASFTRSGGYSDLSDRIAQVTHPTLILWGKADDVPHFDQPQVVANHLLSFMKHVEH
ncbi:MAG TPA: alpha/beta hydrolase [Allocoleopsis sp.]